jgi:hypothetical protein
MKKTLLTLSAALMLAASAWSAPLDEAGLTTWAQNTPVPGYRFGGVDQPDPGVLMAVWVNGQEQMVGLQLRPLAEFQQQANQVVNRRKPLAFSYKGLPALYTDALAPSGSVLLRHDALGRTLILMNMGQPRAFTQAELVKILDGMGVERLGR